MLRFYVGRIPVSLHFSFALLLYIAYTYTGDLAEAVLAGVGIFGGILVHEIGHALTARRFGSADIKISLFALGAGVVITGFFPSLTGLIVTTMIWSAGFHYYEALQQSLAMQWIDKKKAPHTFGRILAVGSFASIACFAMIYVATKIFALDFKWVFIIGGGVTLAIAFVAWAAFPR